MAGKKLKTSLQVAETKVKKILRSQEVINKRKKQLLSFEALQKSREKQEEFNELIDPSTKDKVSRSSLRKQNIEDITNHVLHPLGSFQSFTPYVDMPNDIPSDYYDTVKSIPQPELDNEYYDNYLKGNYIPTAGSVKTRGFIPPQSQENNQSNKKPKGSSSTISKVAKSISRISKPSKSSGGISSLASGGLPTFLTLLLILILLLFILKPVNTADGKKYTKVVLLSKALSGGAHI